MNIISTYNRFLVEHFNSLKIRKPLFYNWSIGLRFDLQKNFENPVKPSDKKYFKEVYRRALAVFEFCFDQEDEIIIVAHNFKWKKKSKIKKSNFIFKQIVNFDSGLLYRDLVNNLYEPDDDQDIWHRAMYQTKLKKIKYKKLILGICNTDFPNRKPHIGQELFFLNLDKKLILNIYDDRGMDLLMTTKENAKVAYEKFSKWILEYDRQKIKNQLKV